MKTTHHRVADDFSELHFVPEVNEVKSQTQDYNDTQYQHVLRCPFHVFRFCCHCIAFVTASCTVLHRQPESVDDVNYKQGSQSDSSYQRIPVGTEELTNHVVRLAREKCNKVHRHVKCQKQDKGDTCDTHHHFPSNR